MVNENIKKIDLSYDNLDSTNFVNVNADLNDSLEESKISKKSKNRKKSTIMIDEEIDLAFRKIAATKFHFCRGWYTKAVNEALAFWIEEHSD